MISDKVKRVRRAGILARENAKPETPDERSYLRVLKQVQEEYDIAWRFCRPRIQEGLKRLKLYNNQKRNKEMVGDPLLFSSMQTLLAAFFSDQLAVFFQGREEGDEDTADNLNGLAEYDYADMGKAQHDYDWTFDALAFGRGLSYFNEFDDKTKTPIPSVWDPLTFLRDPYAVSVRGDRLGNGALGYGGREVYLSKSELKDNPEYFNVEKLKPEGGNQSLSLTFEASQARNQAQGREQSFVRTSGNYAVLQWFTYIDGKLHLVELGNDRTLVIRIKELNTIPLVDRPCYPMAHDWDGVSVFDILEDKQRFRAAMLNVFGDMAKAELYPMYLFNKQKIPREIDKSFGFNKWIGVTGDITGAAAPLQKSMGGSAAQFIMNFLDVSAQKALATPEMQQGQVSTEKRTLGELELVASNVNNRYSLTAKVFGLSEHAFWKRWYEIYDRDFQSGIHKKVIRLMGAFGPQWREITRDKIISGNPLGPDISIESRAVSEAKKRRDYVQVSDFVAKVSTLPGADLLHATRKLGRLIMPKDEVERIIPLTLDEREARAENDKLNEDVPAPVQIDQDHVIHLRIHASAKDNPATQAHLKAHEFLIMKKRLTPQAFPSVPSDTMTPMQPSNQQGMAGKAPEQMGAEMPRPMQGGFVSIFAAMAIGFAIIGASFFAGNYLARVETANQPARFASHAGLLGTAAGTGSFPTSTNNFQDNDTINAGDWNALENWMGTRTSTDTLSINYRLTTSSDPGHRHTTLSSSTVPTTATSTCTAGNFSWDTSYFYYCVGSGVWRRATSSSF